ncbi:hypothetical protein HY489_04235 [Candidatus Woesearchaeota archaeon]|nr:hypothetical protein [Candidatus Woesearchaeota archaeon]
MVLMFFAVLILLAALYAQLFAKAEAPARVIGESQIPLVNALHDRVVLDMFMRGAVEFSLGRATDVLVQKGGFAEAPCGGVVDGCFVVNKDDDPKRVCRPDFMALTRQEFNTAMDGFVAKYNEQSRVVLPLQNFEVSADQGRFTAVSISPVELPLRRVSSPVVIGKVAWRPGVDIVSPNLPFSSFDAAFRTLQDVATACHGDADAQSCALRRVPVAWNFEKKGDVFAFRVPVGRFKVCYGLHVVGAAQTTS